MVKNNYFLWENKYWRCKENGFCKKCKDIRREFGFSKFEDSPIYPGFFNKLKEDVDIFFVLESLGKRKDKEWPKTTEDAIENLRHYYLEKRPLKTFHQSCIRKVLKPFSSFSYIVSDVVKCYVKKSRDKKKKGNFEKAIEYCSQLLKDQIYYYQPRIIVPIGHIARSTLLRFIDEKYHKKIKNLKHGEYIKTCLKKENSKKIRIFVLYCRFPSSWTADYWIQDGGHKPIVKQLKKLL